MFLSRDDLDSVELACRQLHALVQSDAFIKWGALRNLKGLVIRADCGEVTIRREGEEQRV